MYRSRQKRISKACENCRKRKVKCSGQEVCSECRKFGEKCVYRKLYRPRKEKKHFPGPLNSIPISVILNEGDPTNDDAHGTDSDFSFAPNISSLEEASSLLSDMSHEKAESHFQYYGPISNFTFVNQLNHYLRHVESKMSNENGNGNSFLTGLSIEDETKGLEMFGMKSTILRKERPEDPEVLLDIPMDKVTNLLVGYLESWAIAAPFFTAEEAFNMVFETWNNPTASSHNKAIVYLMLSIGAGAGYFDTPLPPDMLSMQRGFYELALKAVPNLMSELSLEAILIAFLMCLTTCNMGDTALSYLYSGHAVRVCIAIGLDKETATENLKPELYQRHRIWVSGWQFENYWSFCVGRPSSNPRDIPPPTLNKEAFTYDGLGDMNRFKMSMEHMRIRKEFGAICSKIYSEIFSSSNSNLAVMNNVEKLSQQVDLIYMGSSRKHLTMSEVDTVRCIMMNYTDIEEWFWIRIYYLYLKLIIFRPFLVFYAYLGLSDNQPKQYTQQLKEGADACARMALELTKFIIELNTAVRMRQPIFFICTYIESSCAVLLFYVVSNISNLRREVSDMIRNIFKSIGTFLDKCSGPYIGSIKIMTKMGLSLLDDQGDPINSAPNTLVTTTPTTSG